MSDQDQLIHDLLVTEKFHQAQARKAAAMRERLEGDRPSSSPRKGDKLKEVAAMAEAQHRLKMAQRRSARG